MLKIKNVSKAVKKGFYISKFWTKKYSPEILLVTGIASAVSSIIFACKATTKVETVTAVANDKLNALKEQEKNGSITKEEKKKKALKVYSVTAYKCLALYTPTIISFVTCVGSMLGSHKIMCNRNAAIAAAYTSVKKGYDAYRERVKDKYGAETEDDIYKNVTKETVKTEGGNTEEKKVAHFNKDTCGFDVMFDASNPNWSPNGNENLKWLLLQQEWLNSKLRVEKALFLSDVYKSLMIEPQYLSDEALMASRDFGWIYDESLPEEERSYISFGLTDSNGRLTENSVNLKNFLEQNAWLHFNCVGNISAKNGAKESLYLRALRQKN